MTNGALGLLPLSLLADARRAGLAANEDVLFSSYRAVPWLARTHAVTMVPSSAALRTLRAIAAGQAGTGRTDRVRRSVVQQRAGGRSGESRCRLANVSDAGRRRRDHARLAAEAAQQPEARGRRQRRTAHAAAAAGHRRRIEVDRAGVAGRSDQGAQPRQGCQ